MASRLSNGGDLTPRVVYGMVAPAAVALVFLRLHRLLAPVPLWVLGLLIGGGVLATSLIDRWYEARRGPFRLNVRITSQVAVTTAIIYATGWGPMLAIGYLFLVQENIAASGANVWKVAAWWSVAGLACGEAGVALGWAPSFVGQPAVHGLAVLVSLGLTFVARLLGETAAAKERAQADVQLSERRFRSLVQSSQDLVFVVDATGAVTYASPSCSEVLGYEPGELLGTDSGGLVHPGEIEVVRESIARARQVPGARAEISMRIRHADGTWRWIEGVATNLLDEPAVQGLVINERDVTERRMRLERQAAIAGLGRDALRARSLEAVVDAAVGSITRMVEVRACQILGVFDTSQNEAAPAQWLQTSLDGAGSADDRLRTVRVPIGDLRRPLAYIEVLAERPVTEDEQQFLEAVAGILGSSVARSHAEDAIRHQAMHDPLTDLPNRALFNDRLEHALSRRARVGGYIAVIVVDLDGFKTVNDSLGHLAGDALLIAVADRFRAALRDFDTIARLGGDEFAILVDDLAAPGQAGRVAQRVLDALARPMQLAQREVAVGASIGITVADRADTRPDQLLSHADAAMYRAKREGKGCYRVFEATMHTAAVERMDLEQALRAAIANGGLTVHYQPVVEAATGQVSSFEALARWHHPTRGSVPPDTFIALAEESGLIIELGRAVLFEACRQTKVWDTAFPHLRPGVAVNVSRLQLVHPSFVDEVTQAIAQAEIGASALTLEVTESVLAADAGRVISVLDALRRTGVRIAIDDFGTGYSSLAALAELPIDTLKIDKRFIDNLLNGRQGRGFVKAIMQLAQTLHLATTAEGVERPEQCQLLHQLGCTHIQGDLFSRPMPARAVSSYLEGGRLTDRKCAGSGGRPGRAIR